MSAGIPKEPIVIYAIAGSQFVFKALAALQNSEVPHYVTFVPVGMDARKKAMPSGGYMVPEMKIGTGEKATVISDSEKILHWIDDKYNAGLFPTKEASALSERASDNTLAATVWYYNNVDPTGYRRSIQPAVRNAFPWFIPNPIANGLINKLMKSQVEGKRKAILEAIPGADEALLNDEPSMRRKMIEELQFFQALLKTPDQKYLLDTEVPTAVDFSVYSQAARLVAGGTNDSEIPACCPELLEDSSLTRLWQWYGLMKEENFVKFKGKRAPKSML
jgi:glutathione S-transferase